MPRKQKRYHFIYKTTCSLTRRFYYGMHSTDSLNDGYLGSGSELSRSIKKYGKECHITKIKEFVPNRKKLRKREAEVVNEEMLKNPLCMNLCKGGKGFDTTGLVTIKDKDDNTFSVSINTDGEFFDELIFKISIFFIK